MEKGSSNNDDEHQEFNLVSFASDLEYSSFIIDITSRALEYSYMMRISVKAKLKTHRYLMSELELVLFLLFFYHLSLFSGIQ